MMTKKRPDTLSGETTKVKTPCGSFYLTLNKHEGELFEVRMTLGKSGNCIKTFLEVFGVMFSILLQAGVPREDLIKTFKKHCLDAHCSNDFTINGVKYASCIDFSAKKILAELEAKNEIPKQ